MNRRTFLQAISTLTGVLAVPSILTAGTQDIRCGVDDLGREICEVGINSIVAQKATQQQYYSQWCWAACISTLFTYYNHPVSQERIVEEAYGDVVNMPASPQRILFALNRDWEDDNGRSFRSLGDPFDLSYQTAISDLRDNHPVLIGTLGHAVLLTELAYYTTRRGPQIVQGIVRDPWPGRPSKRYISAQEWSSISFATRVRVEPK